jgi:hypothetical protein
MSDELRPTDEPLTDAELDAVVGGTGACTLHGGVETPHYEDRSDGRYRCDGRGWWTSSSGRG